MKPPQKLLSIKIPPRPQRTASAASGISPNSTEAHEVKLNELESVRFWVEGSRVVFEKATDGLIAPPVKVSIHDIVAFSVGQATLFP